MKIKTQLFAGVQLTTRARKGLVNCLRQLPIFRDCTDDQISRFNPSVVRECLSNNHHVLYRARLVGKAVRKEIIDAFKVVRPTINKIKNEIDELQYQEREAGKRLEIARAILGRVRPFYDQLVDEERIALGRRNNLQCRIEHLKTKL